MNTKNDVKRCSWAKTDVLIAYHDNEHGRIKMEDASIFEKMCLEMFVGKESFMEIMERREEIREAFHNFNVDQCAELSDEYLHVLSNQYGYRQDIVQNVRHNAHCVQRIRKDFGSLFKFVYNYHNPERLLVALEKYGFRQVGQADVDWLMKNLGIIQGHEPGCDMYTAPGKE